MIDQVYPSSHPFFPGVSSCAEVPVFPCTGLPASAVEFLSWSVFLEDRGLILERRGLSPIDPPIPVPLPDQTIKLRAGLFLRHTTRVPTRRTPRSEWYDC